MHIRAAAVGFGVVAALALAVALAAVIVDHVSKSDSLSTEQGGTPDSGEPVSIVGSINQQP
jgi:hypothetical protein